MKKLFLLTILFVFIANFANAECGVCCKESGGDPEALVGMTIPKLDKGGQCMAALSGLAGNNVNKVLDCAKKFGNETIGSDAPNFISCLKN
jgi:hypothetical protein